MQHFRRRFQQFAEDLTPLQAAYVVGIATAATSMAGGLIVLDSFEVGSVPAVLGLAAVAAVGERGRITLRGRLTVSISLLPALFAAVLFGPLAGMLVFATSALGLEFPISGKVAYASSRAVTGAAAGGIASAVAGGVPGIGLDRRGRSSS